MFQKLTHFYASRKGYRLLFITLVSFFILSPIIYIHPVLEVLFDAAFFLTTILAIRTLNLTNFYLFVARFFAVLAFIADSLVFPSDYLTDLTTVIAHFSYLLFLCLSSISIIFRISSEPKINTAVLQGSICVYLLIGFIWFLLYSIIHFFDPQAFSIPPELSQRNVLLYFSFTTLTTLGYGDISPINPFAMVAANIEAIIGQLYPAIFIAKLVSLYREE